MRSQIFARQLRLCSSSDIAAANKEISHTLPSLVSKGSKFVRRRGRCLTCNEILLEKRSLSSVLAAGAAKNFLTRSLSHFWRLARPKESGPPMKQKNERDFSSLLFCPLDPSSPFPKYLLCRRGKKSVVTCVVRRGGRTGVRFIKLLITVITGL